MALSGNGRTLYEIRGRNDTRLRLTLATDPATAKLRVGLALVEAVTGAGAHPRHDTKRRGNSRGPIPAAPAAARTFAVFPSTRRNLFHLAADVGLRPTFDFRRLAFTFPTA